LKKKEIGIVAELNIFWEDLGSFARKLYYNLYKALDTLYNLPNSSHNTNDDTTTLSYPNTL
jgi:hypothetical protein